MSDAATLFSRLVTSMKWEPVGTEKRSIAVACPRGKGCLPVGRDQIESLRAVMDEKQITAPLLAITGFAFDAPAADSLADLLGSEDYGITDVDLSGCNLGDELVLKIMKRVSGRDIRTMNLAFTNIGVRGAASIAKQLDSTACKLEKLVVKYNPITAQGLGLLLKWACGLREIDARYCGILSQEDEAARDQAMMFISEGLRENTACAELHLAGNGFTEADKAAIRDTLRLNRRSALHNGSVNHESVPTACNTPVQSPKSARSSVSSIPPLSPEDFATTLVPFQLRLAILNAKQTELAKAYGLETSGSFSKMPKSMRGGTTKGRPGEFAGGSVFGDRGTDPVSYQRLLEVVEGLEIRNRPGYHTGGSVSPARGRPLTDSGKRFTLGSPATESPSSVPLAAKPKVGSRAGSKPGTPSTPGLESRRRGNSTTRRSPGTSSLGSRGNRSPAAPTLDGPRRSPGAPALEITNIQKRRQRRLSQSGANQPSLLGAATAAANETDPEGAHAPLRAKSSSFARRGHAEDQARDKLRGPAPSLWKADSWRVKLGLRPQQAQHQQGDATPTGTATPSATPRGATPSATPRGGADDEEEEMHLLSPPTSNLKSKAVPVTSDTPLEGKAEGGAEEARHANLTPAPVMLDAGPAPPQRLPAGDVVDDASSSASGLRSEKRSAAGGGGGGGGASGTTPGSRHITPGSRHLTPRSPGLELELSRHNSHASHASTASSRARWSERGAPAAADEDGGDAAEADPLSHSRSSVADRRPRFMQTTAAWCAKDSLDEVENSRGYEDWHRKLKSPQAESSANAGGGAKAGGGGGGFDDPTTRGSGTAGSGRNYHDTGAQPTMPQNLGAFARPTLSRQAKLQPEASDDGKEAAAAAPTPGAAPGKPGGKAAKKRAGSARPSATSPTRRAASSPPPRAAGVWAPHSSSAAAGPAGSKKTIGSPRRAAGGGGGGGGRNASASRRSPSSPPSPSSPTSQRGGGGGARSVRSGSPKQRRGLSPPPAHQAQPENTLEKQGSFREPTRSWREKTYGNTLQRSASVGRQTFTSNGYVGDSRGKLYYPGRESGADWRKDPSSWPGMPSHGRRGKDGGARGPPACAAGGDRLGKQGDKQTPAILNACLSSSSACRQILGSWAAEGLHHGNGGDFGVPLAFISHCALPNVLNELPLGCIERVGGLVKLLFFITAVPTTAVEGSDGQTHHIRYLPGIPQHLETEDEVVEYVSKIASREKRRSVPLQEGHDDLRAEENKMARRLLKQHLRLESSMRRSRSTSNASPASPKSQKSSRSRSAPRSRSVDVSLGSSPRRSRGGDSNAPRPGWKLAAKKPAKDSSKEGLNKINIKSHVKSYMARPERQLYRISVQRKFDHEKNAQATTAAAAAAAGAGAPLEPAAQWPLPLSQAGAIFSEESGASPRRSFMRSRTAPRPPYPYTTSTGPPVSASPLAASQLQSIHNLHATRLQPPLAARNLGPNGTPAGGFRNPTASSATKQVPGHHAPQAFRRSKTLHT